jgi:endogenous inhibitor of DNA gyrase (YacG/DUF329 family)
MICPTCKRTFDAAQDGDSGQRRPLPFCSARCRLADLGSWLEGNYRIPTTTDDQDVDMAAEADEGPPGSDPIN